MLLIVGAVPHYYQKRITDAIIRLLDCKSGRAGEKSRYLSQIEHEMAEMPNITLRHRIVNLPLSQRKKKTVSVPKTETVRAAVKHYLTEEGLTPTDLSRYLNDPLQFFEEKILKLYESDGVSEELENVTFGNLIHKAIESLFESLIGKTVTAENIQMLRQTTDFDVLLSDILTQEAGGILQDRGKTCLLKQMAATLLLEFLDIQEAETPFQLLLQEQEMETLIPIAISENETLPVKLRGTADRITLSNDAKDLRLIDFKTGRYYERGLKVTHIQDLFHETEKRNVIQLMLYRYLLFRGIESNGVPGLPQGFSATDKSVRADFLFFRALDESYQSYQVKEAPDNPAGFRREIEQFLVTVVRDMLDQSKPFTEAFELEVEQEVF